MISNLELSRVADAILEVGYSTIKLDSEVRQLVHRVREDGLSFFRMPTTKKANFSVEDIQEGFMKFGAEYSQYEDRPDLCEGFATWIRNQDNIVIRSWAERLELHRSTTACLDPFSKLVNEILDALKKTLNASAQSVRVGEASYAQVNYYKPAQQMRTLLQDSHEDGHILTVLVPSAPGVEIEIDGKFQKIDVPPGYALLMPGSVLTLISGGTIAPLFHRVKNNFTSHERLSLMFFANPTLFVETKPWLITACNRHKSIRDHTIKMSESFGRPSIDQ